MSDVVNIGWDTHPYKSLNRYLGKVPAEVKREVTASNSAWAQKLVPYLKAAAPVEGQHVDPRKAKKAGPHGDRWGHGPKHKTGTGVIKASIVAKKSLSEPTVAAKGTKAPHAIVMEFGGSVWWTSRKGGGGRGYATGQAQKARKAKSHISYKTMREDHPNIGHIIGVRKRSPHFVADGKKLGGAAGWWFFPTLRKHHDDIVHSAVEAQQDAIRRSMPRSIT